MLATLAANAPFEVLEFSAGSASVLRAGRRPGRLCRRCKAEGSRIKISVFIDGAGGTIGLEIREQLTGRAEIELIALDESRSTTRIARARRSAAKPSTPPISCPVPARDATAREAVELTINPATRIIDASSAHRVADGWT